MTVSKYELIETFEITRVHPDRDTIYDLYKAVRKARQDEDATWRIDGSCVEFKRSMGSSMTALADDD